ncbi:hypothetical protein Emag_007838 [Eimeria magna]
MEREEEQEEQGPPPPEPPPVRTRTPSTSAASSPSLGRSPRRGPVVQELPRRGRGLGSVSALLLATPRSAVEVQSPSALASGDSSGTDAPLLTFLTRPGTEGDHCMSLCPVPVAAEDDSLARARGSLILRLRALKVAVLSSSLAASS